MGSPTGLRHPSSRGAVACSVCDNSRPRKHRAPARHPTASPPCTPGAPLGKRPAAEAVLLGGTLGERGKTRRKQYSLGGAGLRM
eukprot:scaffold12241_cov107-Isochrysis_galbana.AAC.1